MDNCPVCFGASEAETDICSTCGYSYLEQQIRQEDSHKTQAYVREVPRKNWPEAARRRKRIYDVQFKKHGDYVRHDSTLGWSETKTARMLGESPATTTQNIRLAEALERYPDLAQCKTKDKAHVQLRLHRQGMIPSSPAMTFDHEADLHRHLAQQWGTSPWGADWDLASQNEYRTAVGNIDLLAKHRRDPAWLVIELKKGPGREGDVGQVLRYMDWVQQHHAIEGEKVSGLIITSMPEDRLRSAVAAAPNVELWAYSRHADGRVTFFPANTDLDLKCLQFCRSLLANFPPEPGAEVAR